MRVPNKRQALETLLTKRVAELLEESHKASNVAEDRMRKAWAKVVIRETDKKFAKLLALGAVMLHPGKEEANENGDYWYSAEPYGNVPVFEDRDKLRELYREMKDANNRARTERARVEAAAEAIGVKAALAKDYDAMMALVAELK